MAFGFAITDFVALGKLAWGVYRDCRDAPMEFEEVYNQVKSLRTALQELQDEAEDEDSVLNRADRIGNGRKREDFRLIVTNCTNVLRDLDKIVQRHRSLGTDRKAFSDRIKLDRGAIKDIRAKLVLHTATLTQFMTALNTGSLGRLERGQDQIIHKIDEVAADVRAGVRQPSILSSVGDDSDLNPSQAWERLSMDLLEEIPQDQVEQNKAAIKAYIRELIDEGQLIQQTEEDSASASSPTSTSLRTESSSGPSKTVQPDTVPSKANVKTDSLPLTPESQKPTPSGSQIPLRCIPREKVGSTTTAHTNDIPPSTEKPRHDVHLGINIGSVASQIAMFDISNRSVEVFPNDNVETDIPTCIAFTKTGPRIGVVADSWPDRLNVVKGFVSLLGERYDGDVAAKARKAIDIRCRDGKPFVYVPCCRTCFSPEQLLAVFLQGLINYFLSVLPYPVNVKSLALTIPESYAFLKRQSLATALVEAKLFGDVPICHQTLANVFEWVRLEPILLQCRDFDRLLSIMYCPSYIQYALIEASPQNLTIDRIEGHRWSSGTEQIEDNEHIFSLFTRFIQHANWRPSAARVLLVAPGSNTEAVQQNILRRIEEATKDADALCPPIELRIFGADQTCKGLAVHTARPFCTTLVPSSQPRYDEICGFGILITNHRIDGGDFLQQPPMMLRHLDHCTSERFPRSIAPLTHSQRGILLQVSTPLGPPPRFLDSMLLFELAMTLPSALIDTDALNTLKLDLKFLSIDNFEMEVRTNFVYDMTIVRVHHDACGFLHVLQGETVPITPVIRKEWLIRAVDWQGVT